ncbi:aminotransferase class I and II [Colletotrichum graminicola M1.001]|uniref:Aminotransferase class I and II n=1 Tax=Colletotrichum graminicola (strain M1.001 / M2 / FGSC 10212) TaxID=645133 RepID=E3QUW8_COLGM|nr:aminotransferase class I and II [Colletotrichum graminicola M1.001]EFQ34656.1 aminotransferase class I and II [Colletotrichum graminicola M1.001]
MSAQNALTPSLRGRKSIRPSSAIDFGYKLEQNLYDTVKNPKGIIDMGSAVNELMLDDLSGWTKKKVKKSQLRDAVDHGDTQSSTNLLKAAARFINEHFRVRPPLTNDNVFAANDVDTLLESLTHSIADEGDAILIPTPSCGISAHDVWAKNNVHVVEVPCDDIPEERFWGPPPQEDAPIQAPELVRRLEAAIKMELDQKRKVRGIFLANPDNPLGRCYAAHVLLQVSQLCAKYEIHLIVDETYAMSAGDRFSSILSLGLDMNATYVHVLWGMSKDLGLGGFEGAFLATYNKQTYNAMRSLSSRPGRMSASSSTVAEKLISDTKYLQNHYLPVFRRRLNKRRKLVEEILVSYNVPYDKPEAGLFVFVDLSEWADFSPQQHGREGYSSLLEYMLKQRVFLEPGETFCSKRPGWFRLSFGGEKETFKLGLQRLLHCLKLLDGKEYTVPFALGPGLYFPPMSITYFSIT